MENIPTPRLSAKGRMGSLVLKNRIIMAPMGTNFGSTDGFPTERDKLYYAERARGGVAMVITEAMNITAGARNHTRSLCIFHDRFIPGLGTLVRAIKNNGAYAVAQLNHRGQLLRGSVLGAQPVGPSAGFHPFTGEPVKALDKQGIREIQRAFVEAATRARQAGYDACELHAANGYLFQQFFTRRFNQRTDEYGGSLQNRMRLLLETLDKVKEANPAFPLLVRISATEYAEDGYSQDEILALAQALEAAGIIALDLSGGSNEHPSLSRYCIQPPSFPRRCLEPYAKPFHDALKIPVIMSGRIIEAQDAEEILVNDSADFVAIGRALIADPHWAAKATSELDAPIRRCISCNVCFERLTKELDVSCVTNPFVGTEFEQLKYLEPQLVTRSGGPREVLPQILVIGSGIAGLEAARVAAAEGARVELWESDEQVGGQMPLALAAPDKEDVAGVLTYRMAALKALAVDVRVGVNVTSERIRDLNPDHILVATGSIPRHFPMLDESGLRVVQAWDVLRTPQQIKSTDYVTIVGGGLVGLEALDLLITQGISGATVIEAQGQVAIDMARNNRYEIMQRVHRANVRIFTDARILRAGHGGIMIRRGREEFLISPGDVVISAVGSVANRRVVPVVEATGIPYTLVGDCNKPGNFMTVIADAALAALAAVS
ncbi:MAG: FAD-dependent oxidoreductase [Castellaniella sp.]